MVNAVSKEKNGIGYGGAAYAKGVKEVKVVGKDGKGYAPKLRERASRASTRWPATSTSTRAASRRARPRTFIDYCLSPAGQALVSQVGYFPVK